MSGPPSPFRVGLLLTEKCGAGCAHCWFDCDLERGTTISREYARNYIDEITRVPTIEWLSVTGGEPMLYPNLAEEIVSYASGRGLRTELVTNCGWAESPTKAMGVLRRLVDVGLDVLDISADDYHQASIPFGRVRACYDAAKGLGIKMVVMTAVGRTSRMRLAEVSRLLGEDIPNPRDADRAVHVAIGVESPFIPVGKAASLPRDEWVVDVEPLSGGCDSVLRDLGLRPSGEVLPCCSAAAALPGFGIGNLNDAGLEELVVSAWEVDIFRILRDRGPMGLVGGSPVGYVNKCHLCHEVLKGALKGYLPIRGRNV